MRTVLAFTVVLVAAGASFWKNSKPDIFETRAPVTIQGAQKCPIPLPPNARNVYFAYYSDAPVYQSFVRFELPYEEGIAQVEKVFRAHAAAMRWPFRMPVRKAISETPQLDFKPVKALHVSWFDIGRIRNGVTFGELNSWQPQVWIDKDRNLFYFCVTD
jgi:hypothetical protein